ncbi:hypothetical protein [Kitasatospora kifunensis]|uniref:Uncharacterized protein n=1 Tax=Kitasatospora kifunensis TaxID=58351 RepID=A0A7W7QYS5_KITKI|nr:hypothetical protein [Kitasatospora kifunensis]MBB4922297.1 hypothetical protein [Kitasatospora kifunensis]
MATTSTDTPCADCGAKDAPHLGETKTTRIADGVVRDERVRRCTPCQLARPRYEPEQIYSGHWVIRDRRYGVIVATDDDDCSPRIYSSRDTAQASLDELVSRGAL